MGNEMVVRSETMIVLLERKREKGVSVQIEYTVYLHVVSLELEFWLSISV